MKTPITKTSTLQQFLHPQALLLVPAVLLLALFAPNPCAAQALTITFNTPNAAANTAAADQTYTFFGTLTNTSSQPLYFNADLIFIDPALSSDDSDFIDTFVTPTDSAGNLLPQPEMGAGQSVNRALFSVTLPQGTLAGTYGGTFQVQGGSSTSDYGILGTSEPFTLTNSPSAPPLPAVPEASSALSFSVFAALAVSLAAWKRTRAHA